LNLFDGQLTSMSCMVDSCSRCSCVVYSYCAESDYLILRSVCLCRASSLRLRRLRPFKLVSVAARYHLLGPHWTGITMYAGEGIALGLQRQVPRGACAYHSSGGKVSIGTAQSASVASKRRPISFSLAHAIAPAPHIISRIPPKFTKAYY
jgi:hypothetical protein